MEKIFKVPLSSGGHLYIFRGREYEALKWVEYSHGSSIYELPIEDLSWAEFLSMTEEKIQKEGKTLGLDYDSYRDKWSLPEGMIPEGGSDRRDASFLVRWEGRIEGQFYWLQAFSDSGYSDSRPLKGLVKGPEKKNQTGPSYDPDDYFVCGTCACMYRKDEEKGCPECYAGLIE